MTKPAISDFNASHSRRSFLTGLGLSSLFLVTRSGRSSSLTGGSQSAPIQRQAGESRLVKNRLPLSNNAFYALPLGSIKPRGWLRRQLEIQANGLGGHLDETWADVGPNSGWLGGTGESWERGPYFLDGLIPLAWLLDDERLKKKAMRFVDWTLEHQQANGMIGPASNDDWWPRFVVLKALTQYQELSSDPRVIPVIDRYFRHQLEELPRRPLRDWGKFRWQDEVLSVIWLYNRTGSAYLLDLARILHAQGHDWMAQYADFQFKERITKEFLKLDADHGNGLKDLSLSTHGVNNAQALKTGPVWSQVSRSADDRAAAKKMLDELDQYHGLPNGMFSCDEHLAGRNPSQGSELCSVVESMFSLEQALAITGDPSLGDRLEKLAFNALPGTFTDDMWAHQYNQQSNQVECSLHHKPWATDGPESNLYGLEPNFGCCTANFHQGWPKFANSLVLASGDQESDAHDGLVVSAYAPCEVNTMLRGTHVQLIQETDYPFKGLVRISVNPAAPISFPLQLRIPAWAAGAELNVNGQPLSASQPNSFTKIERTWHSGDVVGLLLPMEPRITRWFNDSIAVERGPLVFSYNINENWVKLRDRGMTADWQVFPKTQWNYALAVDGQGHEKGIRVIESVVGEQPFARKETSVRLQLKASKLDKWLAVDGCADPPPQSPVSTGQSIETIDLVPYAAAKLRITAFPQLKEDGATTKSST
jgi:hypothetical protein